MSAPPACAMSGRPPPPLPPSSSAAALTRSTAESRPVRSAVTPAATAALPPVSAISSTAPDPIRAFISSISAGQILARNARQHLRQELHPADLLRLRASRPCPPIATSRRSCATSFCKRAAFLDQRLHAVQQHRPAAPSACRATSASRAPARADGPAPPRPSAPRSAARPAEDAESPSSTKAPMSPGARHMGAAAQFQRIGLARRRPCPSRPARPSTRRAPRRRISRRTAPARRWRGRRRAS